MLRRFGIEVVLSSYEKDWDTSHAPDIDRYFEQCRSTFLKAIVITCCLQPSSE